MGKLLSKLGGKAADKVAKLAVLSPEQISDMMQKRAEYLAEKPDPQDVAAEEFTRRLIAKNSVEIYNAYLPQLSELYTPVEKDSEYRDIFDAEHNIRFFNVTKWVIDKNENSLEKLINVYEVLSNEECNIALVFHRTITETRVYLAVTNTKNEKSNENVNDYIERLQSAVRGNFPGAEFSMPNGEGRIPCLKNDYPYSIASVSNIPTEKSEKFISQTIEKLLDGIIPDKKGKEYIVVLLATPVKDVENRKLRLAEFYSGLAPYASWQTDFTYTQSDSTNSMATFGVNAGVSAGIQQGQNSSMATSDAQTKNSSKSESQTENDTTTENQSLMEGENSAETEQNATAQANTQSSNITVNQSQTNTQNSSQTHTDSSHKSMTAGVSANESVTAEVAPLGVGGSATVGLTESISTTGGSSVSDAVTEGLSESITEGLSETTGNAVTDTISRSLSSTVGRSLARTTGTAVAKSIGKTLAQTTGEAVTKTLTNTVGLYKGVNFGGNFGANFARSSNITATVGKNEGIHQTFTNYTIKHTLELLEEQMKRYEQSQALGMWDFAAYVLSEDPNTANNVAHTYLALTQGEKSHMSCSAVNLWRGDMGDNSGDAKEICSYIKELRHPIFALNPVITEIDNRYNVYPAIVTAATSLSGKELAYSLNFPQKSIAGLPVIECAEFGRSISVYGDKWDKDDALEIGKVFHMNHVEKAPVTISKQSLASHTFVTGSTGSGKSNTVYTIIDEALQHNCKFLVVEPAKGEYKNVYGNASDVTVYGTNPKKSNLLRINPFSFPEDIHVLEHLDRLVEIFNVCWPMYAAMPAVLKSAIEKSYEDCGWDLISSENEYGNHLFPKFSDVARNVKQIIDSSEYDAENKGAYKGALLTRLQSLATGLNGMLFTDDEIGSDALFDENVIVDISRVGSNETKSLIMGMLVLKLQEYRMTNADFANSELKHITVLEEAHNILKRTSTEQTAEGSNLVGKSVEMITNAIAEMRTYGEGFVIVDQAPGLLDMAVIRNTNTKIIMRLPDQGDRELVGRAANLSDDQIQELAKLPCGVGAVYQNEWIQPVLCKIHKADTDEVKFIYAATPNLDTDKLEAERIRIAKLLSEGSAFGDEVTKTEIAEALDKLKLDAYVKVTIMKILENPPKEPRMTKLAPIMSALFPSVKDAVKTSYFESHEPECWTRSAENALAVIINTDIDNQVKRDIIQAIITQYFLFEINNENDLREWSQRGGLR